MSEIGYTDGDRPHSYSNIVSWADHIGLKLDSFELSLLVMLSALYLSSFRQYNDKDNRSFPPYRKPVSNTERAAVESAVRTSLGLFKSKGKRDG